ncbi:MAG: DNA polymerase I [Actinomycetota bacterium]
MDEKKILLIDGNNLAYRAFYALPDTIATSSGTKTNAVLGFTSMLLKLIDEEKPESIICAFDSKGPTFRHDMYKEYKMHRKKMPEELTRQLPLIKEVLKVFNILCLEKPGYEADDIIATIVKAVYSKFNDIYIITGDKDILQLVSDKVRVIANKKGITDTVIYDEEKVREKYGVGPEKIKDLLALIGDSSDNIPGIPGIGPKTAEKLLKEYEGLGDIFKNIDNIESKRIKNLLKDKEDLAKKSLRLTELKLDQDLDVGEVVGESFRNIDLTKVRNLFHSLEFRNLYKKLEKIELSTKKSKEKEKFKTKVKLTELRGRLDSFTGELEKKLYLFLGGMGQPFILLWPGKKNVYYVSNEDMGELKNQLAPFLEDKNIVKSGYDFKAIYKFLKDSGINMGGTVVDFKILYLLLFQQITDISIDDLILNLLNTEIGNEIKQEENAQLELSFEPQIDKGLKKISLYNQIEGILLERVKGEGLERVYSEIEEPLIKVLASMEHKGVYVDENYLRDLIKEYEKNIKSLEKQIYDISGEVFNINSPQQLASILYEKLGLPPSKKTKTGYSTDASSLYSIKHLSPVIEKILDYREKTKLKNTYIDVLPKLIDPEDGRIHATYNQMGTTTGRISSSEPNLQNIPVRTELGRKIRKAFIPGEGYDLILAADYSQIELRILAHLSNDRNLIEAFNRDEDIHSRTASEIFNVDYKDVSKDLRRKAKAINFGIIYGMTKYGLKSRLQISEEEAMLYIEKYFSRYPKVSRYIEDLKKEAYKNGYTTTIFGRKRVIKEIGSSNIRLRNLGERLAVNTPIQGSAADIMKLSTVLLFNRLQETGIDSNIILHVHDELVLELKKKDLEKVTELVKNTMEDCVKLRVKLKVDIKTGQNWYI